MLMDDQINIRLIDFGLSCYYNSEHCRYGGTPGYMSPLLYSSRPVFNPLCDVWSATILLYFLYNNKDPYPKLIDDEGNGPLIRQKRLKKQHSEH